MHKKSFWGIYAPYIEEFISFKRSLGFKYKSEEAIYFRFDRFTIETGETKVGITKELADKWCERKNGESDSTRYHRVVCLNQLSSYLSKLGIRSYIPQIQRCKDNTFTPYIFSKTEIAAIFKACDEIRAKKKNMNSMYFALPTLLRFLYGTGLRISEALSLTNKDVNLVDNYIVLRDCKNGKERMIPIAESLSKVCRDYVSYRGKLPIDKKNQNDYFFVSLNGSVCTSDTVYKWFREVLKSAGIPFIGKGHGPRVHDIRHTFSVHSLAMMAEFGVDLYCSLPILSTFLGHQSLSATNTYVRLTSEMYPGLLKGVDMICLNVFPNIESHDPN